MLNVFNLRYTAPAAVADSLAGQAWFTELQACSLAPTDLVAQASADSFELFLGNVVYTGLLMGALTLAHALLFFIPHKRWIDALQRSVPMGMPELYLAILLFQGTVVSSMRMLALDGTACKAFGGVALVFPTALLLYIVYSAFSFLRPSSDTPRVRFDAANRSWIIVASVDASSSAPAASADEDVQPWLQRFSSTWAHSHRALFTEFVEARGSWASMLLLLVRQYASAVLLGLDSLWQDRLTCDGEVWSILVLLAVSLVMLIVMRPYRDAASMYCEMGTLALETIFAALLVVEVQTAGTVPVQALYAVAGAILFLNIGVELQFLLKSRLVSLVVCFRPPLRWARLRAVRCHFHLFFAQAFVRGFAPNAPDAQASAAVVENNQIQPLSDSDDDMREGAGGRSSPPLPSLEPIPDGVWATPRRAISPSEASSTGDDHEHADDDSNRSEGNAALPPSPTRAALPMLPSRDIPSLTSKRKDRDRPSDSQRSSPSEGSGSGGSISAGAPSVRLDDPGMARTRLPKRKGKGSRADGGKFEPLFIQDPD